MRSILHVNIDSFCAAVERKRRPDLLGKPVIVGRAKGSTSGVVVSASEEAQKAGVQENMSVRQAQRACPDTVVLRADYASYRQVSDDFLDILAQYSPLLEPDSLGSAYLDVTASRDLFGDASQISARIASEVSERLDLPLSVGCASNKLLAGIASMLPHRDRAGFAIDRLPHYDRAGFAIPPGSESEFLSPLPVGVLDAVNGKIEKRLHELGVSSVGQLAEIPERLLVRQFGPIGSIIKKQSLGIDSSPVKAAYPPEIIIIERPFDTALEEPAEVEEHLRQMASETQIKLRKRCSLAGEVTLKLFDDSFSNLIPSYFRFKRPTDAILQSLVKLLRSKVRAGMQISRVQIVLSDLTQGDGLQLCLIGEGERKYRVESAIELIRERFGEGSVFLAASLVPAGRARVLSRIAA